MNILPKKRWHVRTKENIARVRRDEAQAAEEEKERQRRIELAEKEAKTNLLRQRARAVYDGRDESTKEEQSIPSAHINFFEELEKGEAQVVKPNEEYEKEKKEEKEKYEKQIGYLTYLGQDVERPSGQASWYNRLPDRSEENEPEILIEKKVRYDPLAKINYHLDRPNFHLDNNKKPAAKKKKMKKRDRKKKHSNISSSDSSSDESPPAKQKPSLDELRAKRLKREQEERIRAAALLARLRGDITPEAEKPKEPILKQKYNSQFNPHIAKQNSFI